MAEGTLSAGTEVVRVQFRYVSPKHRACPMLRAHKPIPVGDGTYLTHVSLRAGYSTEADIPKIIGIVEGRPVEVLEVTR